MAGLISIAMCTYNGEKYLSEQIESILKQTVLPDEIVICDDCSKDRTVEVAKSTLANWQGKIKIVKNEHNLGYKLNFQKAISLCSGDIIFLCDQDDVWYKDKIAKLLAVFESDKEAIMAFHDVNIVNDELIMLQPSFWSNMVGFSSETFKDCDYDILYRCNVVQGASCAFRRTLFEYAKPFCQEAHHDEWLALVAQTKGKIVPINTQLAAYRQTGTNAIGVKKESVFAKLHRWTRQSKQSAKNRHDSMIRRYAVLSDFAHTYTVSSQFGKQYIEFLKKRLDKGLCMNVLDYMRFESTLLNGIKEFIADVVVKYMTHS